MSSDLPYLPINNVAEGWLNIKEISRIVTKYTKHRVKRSILLYKHAKRPTQVSNQIKASISSWLAYNMMGVFEPPKPPLGYGLEGVFEPPKPPLGYGLEVH
ncbi:unnamed protein product, partial [Timema podura]|nr:unnamed protein product [Timema podura]